MPGIPTIRTAADGSTVVMKRGRGREADQRRREAEVLRRSAHPGVVELRGIVESSEGLDLELAFVAGTSLADHPPLQVAKLGRIAASVATTLVDLHERGVRHGDICAEHILVDHRDRAVLCGFGNAGIVESEQAPPTTADVAAIGRLIIHELGRSEAAGVIDANDWTAVALHDIADDALAVVRAGSTTALAPFAARLVDLSGAAQQARPQRGRWPRLRRRPARGSATPSPARTPAGFRRVGAAALVCATAVVLGAWAWNTTTDSTTDSTPPAVATGPTLTTPPTAAPPAAPATTGAVPVLLASSLPRCGFDGTEVLGPDLDADGCREQVRVEGDRIISETGTWRLGAPGDVVAIGDWDCDGVHTPALVTREMGAVFMFDAWSDPSQRVFADAVAVVGPASGAQPEGECGALIVDTATGPVHVDQTGVRS